MSEIRVQAATIAAKAGDENVVARLLAEHVRRLIIGGVLVRAESVDIAPYVVMTEVA